MLRIASVSLLSFFAISAAVMAGQQTAPPPPLGLLAIVRADGGLLPLAGVRGQRWRRLAVDTGSGASRLAEEAKQLPRDGWKLLPRNGDPGVNFELRARTTLKYECQSSEGFATTLPSRPARGTNPSDVVGLAVRGNLNISRTTNIAAATDADSSRVRRFLTTSILAMETERFEDPNSRRSETTVITPALRQSSPLRFRLLFHHKALEDWYYFEAEKEYANTGFGFSSSGWFSAFASEAALHEFGGHLYGTNGELASPPNDLLGVISEYPGAPAVWVMAEYTNVDVLFELLRVGDYPPKAIQHLFTISANHCIP